MTAGTGHGSEFPPVFATNRADRGETVAREVNRLLGGLGRSWRPRPTSRLPPPT